MKKVNIGFDIGITSVGWAIVDEENNIINRGVRLFEELKNPKGKLENEERRKKRALRRTIRRKNNRKNDFVKLIINDYSSIFNIKTKEEFLKKITDVKKSIIEIRNEAIIKEVKKEELLKVLYYFLAHRGYTYLTTEKFQENNEIVAKGRKNNLEQLSIWLEKNLEASKTEQEKEAEKYNQNKDFKTTKSVIVAARKFQVLNDKDQKFPCQIQLEEFKSDGHYQGLQVNASFSIHDYKKEIEKIIANQKYLTPNFKNDYYIDEKSVFSRIREYSKGPGSEISPSKYGLYRKNENGEIQKIGDNLWDVLVGECSIYTDQKRAMKRSVSGEFSNLMSQLNNIKNENEKLLQEQKIAIFNEILKGPKFKKIDIKLIAKIVNCESSDIKGYPTSNEANGVVKEAFDEMKNTKKLFNILNEFISINSFDKIMEKIDLLDEILAIFLKHQSDIDGQRIALINLSQLHNNILNNDLIEKLISADFKVSETHSLSYKALREHINDEIRTKGLTVNQKFKKIIEKNQIDKFKFGNSKYMNQNCLDHEIMSPTTKCSFRETIKIFNKILKLYVYKNKFKIKNIILEMPTEWNSKEEREKIDQRQKRNKAIKESVKEWYSGDDKKIIGKLHLLKTQDNCDPYDGEQLDPNKVASDPNYVEIDHIIPYSISYDDSFNNKVLTKRYHNSSKGNKTPRQYINYNKFIDLEKNLWKRLYNDPSNKNFYSPKKYNNLTIYDISRYEAGFVGRNLSDTRYASRLVNQAFNAWIETKLKLNNHELTANLDDEINVVNVNGRTSQKYRYEDYLNIGSKNRDENYHHAVDATICAILGNADNTVGKLVWSFNRKIDDETGVVTYSKESKYFHGEKLKFETDKIKWKDLSKKINDFSDIKFSFKVQKKSNNFGFWGDTILSVKKQLDKNQKEVFQNKKHFEFLKYANYKDAEKAILEIKKFYSNNVKYPDPKIFEDVLKIWDEYSIKCQNDDNLKSKNPFVVYMEEMIEKELTKNTRFNRPRLYINRHGHEYYINSLFIWEKINSFIPKDRKNKEYHDQGKSFGAFTKMFWTQIRVYKIENEKYRVVSISRDLIKEDEKHNLIVDEIAMNKFLKDLNINNDNLKYFTINKGNCLINDENEILKIVGIDQGLNLLDIRKLNIGKQKRQKIAINTLMNNYKFCHIDILGNIKKVDF